MTLERLAAVCQCPIKYRYEIRGGRRVAVLDEPLPALGTICEKCGQPHLVDLESKTPEQ